MMRTAFRGLVLALGVGSLPLIVQADCPPEESIDRYAQTAGDALSALHELVPVSQQGALEDRYTAMVMLKWHWQGREAIRADEKATGQLLKCYKTGACGINRSDAITTQILAKLDEQDADPQLLESLLPQQPSSDSVEWAASVLDCAALMRSPVIIDEPSPEPAEQEPESDALDLAVTASDTEIVETTGDVAEQEPVAESEVPTDSPSVKPSLVIAADPPQVGLTSVVPVIIEKIEDLTLSATLSVSAGKTQDAIAALEEACILEAENATKSSACEALFEIFTDSYGASESTSQTHSYLDLSQRLCDLGHSRGCDNLSQYHSILHSPESDRLAVEYAQRSCDLSDADACARVSQFYLVGQLGTPDTAAAREKLEQSCYLGRLLSCQEVAVYYLRGVGGASDKDAALQMVQASCPENAAQRPDLCVSAADFILINTAESTDRSTLIRTLLKRACDIGHDIGCAWYAEDLELGLGGDVDTKSARLARRTACKFGDTESCNPRS